MFLCSAESALFIQLSNLEIHALSTLKYRKKLKVSHLRNKTVVSLPGE